MIDNVTRHIEPSMVMSLDDEPWRPSPRLIQLSIRLAALTPGTNHPILARRHGGGRRWYRQFPGEHYHLLTAICHLLQPASVWEFGTDTGMSTVAMLEGLPPSAGIVTVDIEGWRTKRDPWLIEEDFASGRVIQLVSDMKAPALFADHLRGLPDPELIFVDGPKDGVTEAAFLGQLAQLPFRQPLVVVFDDIRLLRMVQIWRDLQHPKMDMTSFGHWSGTGLVEWHPSSAPALPDILAVSPPIPDAHSPASAGMGLKAGSPRAARSVIGRGKTMRILMLCDAKPSYIPDLLLHGLRKLLGDRVVDHPRKDAVYHGCLGQAYLDPVPGLMAPDDAVDRSDIPTKARTGFFDLVLCDIRALNANRALLHDSICPLALIDGEDQPARIVPGNYAILRRETDGSDFSIPLPMGMPVEILDWIDLHADQPKSHSIAFLGSRSSLTPERNAVLDRLRGAFPNALVESWEVRKGRWQGRDACYRAMQSCKAVLSLPGAGYDTFRYWENAGCSAAHVAMRTPLFVPADFRNGQEILRFADVHELIAIVDRIMADETDWRAFAMRSRQWLRAYHTTEQRAIATLDRLTRALG